MLAGTVMLGDLNDFIAPSQACVNPLYVAAPGSGAAAGATTTAPPGPSDVRGRAKIDISSDWGVPVAAVTTPLAATAAVVAAPVKPNLIRPSADGGGTAKVSLNDCLACSGCVTSAETVLIAQQSVVEVERALATWKDDTDTLLVISFAPQAVASLAAHFGSCTEGGGLDLATTFRKLVTFFKGLGFHAVVDTVAAAEVALYETCLQVAATRAAASPSPAPSKPRWQAPQPTMAVSSTSMRTPRSPGLSASITGVSNGAGSEEVTFAALVAMDAQEVGVASMEEVLRAGGAAPTRTPLLVSACPGWVCYAEKTVPEALPYMSTVKSQQQVVGGVVKQVCLRGGLVPAEGGGGTHEALAAAPGAGSGWSRVYHVSVMMCYDKKLEASRRDFYWQTAACAEVDCVLTSGEVAGMVAAAGVDWVALPCAPLPPTLPPPLSVGSGDRVAKLAWLEALMSECARWPTASPAIAGGGAGGWAVDDGGEMSSDGYVEVVGRYLRAVTGGSGDGALRYTPGRNPDFLETSVPLGGGGGDSGGTYHGAIAYGFRNIQTVVNRLKTGRGAVYDCVEVMACPAGCIGGGGQCTPVVGAGEGAGAKDAANKARLAELKAALRARACQWADVGKAPQLWQEMFGGEGEVHTRAGLTRTRFHHVPKMDGLGAAAKW